MGLKMTIEFPDGADDFKEGIILLDEAVGRFMESDHEHADCLEMIISAIVRETEERENLKIERENRTNAHIS